MPSHRVKGEKRGREGEGIRSNGIGKERHTYLGGVNRLSRRPMA